jgi:succinyl-diaminopimelate desuccinylase
MSDAIDRILAAVDGLADEAVAFTRDLVRIPTVNPPGDHYEDCARRIGDTLASFGYAVEYHAAEGRPEHTPAHPRVNVVATLPGASARPVIHLNGHVDVVPPGEGWTVDPFGGLVRDGFIWGRGAADMKAGIAAAVFAVEAIRRAGVRLDAAVEISGTVDEESGGLAGVAWLAERRRIAADRTGVVIIPEPLGVDRVCVGHRGVYWFDVETRGHIAHGSMPFLGISAIDHMTAFLAAIDAELRPRLAARTTALPVIPAAARHPTLNVNGIAGGQPVDGVHTPCVADRCRAVFDRRFLHEEGFDAARDEIRALLRDVASRTPDFHYELTDLLVVHPTRTPDDSPLVATLDRAIRRVLGRDAAIVLSPGTYDHKHVAGIAGVPHCVAYGPGALEQAHQPDERCAIEDLIASIRVLSLAVLELAGGPSSGS